MKVTLMSGLPGSGKSTLARKLASETSAEVISADDYFMTKGEYVFNPAGLGAAHGLCLRRFVSALQSRRNVIVDNTNTTAIELAPYVAIAAAYGAKVTLVTVHVSVDVSAERNTHGVPRHAIERMSRALASRELPPFWDISQEEVL